MTSNATPLARWHSWSNRFLTREIRDQINRIRAWPDVERVVTLPDVHLAGKTLNGAVVATHERIYPSAVGADIGCGMRAVRLELRRDFRDEMDLRHKLFSILRRAIPILKANAGKKVDLPDPSKLSAPELRKAAERDGIWQLGSLGRGNHFLELQVTTEGEYWLLVHSGSRAMGQIVTAFHESRKAANGDQPALSISNDRGNAYLNDLKWCRRYALANRAAIMQRALELAADLLPVQANLEVALETDHNHLEVREGLLVHRKGAQGIRPGEWGIVPGSLASATYHVSGRGSCDALDSCSHGAGRRLSRNEAHKNIPLREVRRSLQNVTYDEAMVGAIVDEAPAAYRDIEAVMRAQRDLVNRILRLEPLLTLKGGR
jgi:tRNA-splicing ligase RtcB